MTQQTVKQWFIAVIVSVMLQGHTCFGAQNIELTNSEGPVHLDVIAETFSDCPAEQLSATWYPTKKLIWVRFHDIIAATDVDKHLRRNRIRCQFRFPVPVSPATQLAVKRTALIFHTDVSEGGSGIVSLRFRHFGTTSEGQAVDVKQSGAYQTMRLTHSDTDLQWSPCDSEDVTLQFLSSIIVRAQEQADHTTSLNTIIEPLTFYALLESQPCPTSGLMKR